MTFLHHSDVPVPYGRIVPRQDGDKKVVEDIYSTKPKLVATLQSHCGGGSGRFEYIDQLVNYLQVSTSDYELNCWLRCIGSAFSCYVFTFQTF